MIYIQYCFFQPNSTNEGLKEREEDPILIRRVEHHTQYCKKNNMIIRKGCPKFGMATYTKETVIIK